MRKTVCAVLALCLFACSRADLPRAPRYEDAQALHQQIPVGDDEFDLTVEQFTHAFNAVAKACHQPYRIGTVELLHNALGDDYFRQSFSNDVSLTVTVSRDTGRITSIRTLASGKNGTPDRDTMFAIAEVIVLITTPRMTQEKAARMIADMLDESLNTGATRRPPQRYFEHARYLLRYDDGSDYRWIASPK
ncbi:MAG TPA: hypothetical protein VL528_01895 [Oxalicibacterium sp.]|jgi:hypothetical protein|nr:hypothetical protein [Oxalicibacterium sp.]